MYLKVVPSDSCALHHIRMPAGLMKSLNLDCGDWLVFGTKAGPVAVSVVKAGLLESLENGEDHAIVSNDSPILEANSTEVTLQHHNVTVGADPEFYIVSKNSRALIEAFKVLPFESQLGSDGDLGELRPDWAYCPLQLTENIKKLIEEMPLRLPSNLYSMASSFLYGRCCGFHVHLGLPIELMSFAASHTDAFLKHLVACLDFFVAIPAAALDTDDKRRVSPMYGKPGDYRLSMRTLEYRTPGGFHLKSPVYTRSLLASSFKVASKILSDAEEVTEGWTKMDPVSKFGYFRARYNIPDKPTIAMILTASRSRLEQEARNIVASTRSFMDDYADLLITERLPDKPLLEEWLNET